MIRSVTAGWIVLYFLTSAATGLSQDVSPSETLKTRYAAMFDMGTAINPFQLHGENAAHGARQFNSLTAENCMKPEALWRPDGSYNFAPADEIASFARDNGMKLRGHTLVWHSQTPRAFFLDEQGNKLSKEALFARMDKYIEDVMTHFQDEVYCWDVVNEALSDGGENIYRTRSPWYEICGKEFIAHAFRTAHRINPKAKLYYNDYNLISPVKRGKAVAMLKELTEQGVPITGVGMQAHWDIQSFNPDELQKSIDAFSELGLDVQITELDMTVYTIYHGPDNELRNKSMAPKEYTEELANLQAEKYAQVFEVLRRNADKISSVTFWGISDRFSWLSGFPRRGRTDYPLLFDRNNQPKKAYFKVMEIK